MKTLVTTLFIALILFACNKDENIELPTFEESTPSKEELVNKYFGYINGDQFSICIEFAIKDEKDLLIANSVRNYRDTFNIHFNEYDFTLDTNYYSFYEYHGSDSSLIQVWKGGYGRFIPSEHKIELSQFDNWMYGNNESFATFSSYAIRYNLVEYEGVYFHSNYNIGDSVFISKDIENGCYDILIKTDKFTDGTLAYKAYLACTGLVESVAETDCSHCYPEIEFVSNQIRLHTQHPDRDEIFYFSGYKVGSVNLP